jgi:dTDP-glucose pyrophosphorylase
MSWTGRGLKCVVLCAGSGERALPATEKVQKVMLEAGGRPLIRSVIDYWSRFTRDFVFVVGYRKEQVIDYVKALPISAEFAEQGEQRGIAHAVSCAEEIVGDRFIVVLGDCVCSGDFVFPRKMEQGIGVWEPSDASHLRQNYSVEISEGFVSRVVEKPGKAAGNLCGMGFYFLDKRVFSHIASTKPSEMRNEVEITDVMQRMINAGEKISPVFFRGKYINVTYPEDLKRAALLSQ